MDAIFALTFPDGWKIGVVLGLLVVAIILFAIEAISVDLVTLLMLLALVGTKVLSVQEAFSGFGSEIIIILGSIFVLCGAVQETGLLETLGAKLVTFANRRENRLLLLLMLLVSSMSAFMNNTTVTAIFVGPVRGVARKADISPSRILLPMAFASILGGTCTLIGTSTNVAVSGFIMKEGLAPLGLFEMTPIGLIIIATGIAYLVFIGRRFLPDHRIEGLSESEAIRGYLSEIVVLPDSRLIGQHVLESDLTRMDFRVLKILRGKETFVPDPESIIRDGDILLVTGRAENLAKVKGSEGIQIMPDWKLGVEGMVQGQLNIAEALVTPQSNLVGRSLKETRYREQYDVIVLAIYRRDHPLREKIDSIKLKVGDLLLVRADKEHLASLQQRRELAVLAELPPSVFNKRKGLYAIGFFLAALLLGGFGLLPLPITLLGAAILTVLSGCISIEQAHRYINWRLLILIGGMTSFGIAIHQAHADEFLAHWIVTLLKPWGEITILAGFFVLTILLTQPMSNAAAALVVLPVALETARELGANERTFAIAIMLAASVSLIAPFEPSCILVYAPGKYRFRDFVKIGLPLTFILAVIILFFIPVFWPLHLIPGHGRP
ncbi:MAG TPA: SLC13 family permease [Candidatus Angelobacter sp.]|nr:SLC13 family permease [Candidatus Angelobacter sp.]